LEGGLDFVGASICQVYDQDGAFRLEDLFIAGSLDRVNLVESIGMCRFIVTLCREPKSQFVPEK
jgi:hypothetical protein